MTPESHGRWSLDDLYVLDEVQHPLPFVLRFPLRYTDFIKNFKEVSDKLRRIGFRHLSDVKGINLLFIFGPCWTTERPVVHYIRNVKKGKIAVGTP